MMKLVDLTDLPFSLYRRQIRNEAGVIISTQKDKPGYAYRNWKKKTHKEVGFCV